MNIIDINKKIFLFLDVKSQIMFKKVNKLCNMNNLKYEVIQSVLTFNDKWIFKKNYKLKNPLCRGNDYGEIIIKYHGNYKNYDFGSQTINMKKLRDSLMEYGIFFTNIFVTKWKIWRTNHVSFIVDTNTNLTWHKYESNTVGSSQNKIYLNKNVNIQLTHWLNHMFNIEEVLINNNIIKKNII